MPFIAFELDAIRKAGLAAMAAGVPREKVTDGLLSAWEYCWREKTDQVSDVHLLGFFGCDLRPALKAFGFIKPNADEIGCWYVRGAERYLRIRKARSAGGHASKSHLIPGGKRATKPSQIELPADELSRLEPTTDVGSVSALTASSEQRTANSEHLERNNGDAAAPQGLASEKAVTDLNSKRKDPRFRPLQKRLCDSFHRLRGAAYLWQGAKDSEALKRLMGGNDDDEIVRRWEEGLQAIGWERVNGIGQLWMKWNDLAKKAPNGKSPVRAEDTPKSAFANPGRVHDF